MNRRRIYAFFAMTALVLISFFVEYAEKTANPTQSGKEVGRAEFMLGMAALSIVALTCAFLAARKELSQPAPEADGCDAPDEKVTPPSGRSLAIDLALPVSYLGFMLSSLLDTSSFAASYRPLAMGVAAAGGIVVAIYIYAVIHDYRIARRTLSAA